MYTSKEFRFKIFCLVLNMLLFEPNYLSWNSLNMKPLFPIFFGKSITL